MSMVQRAACGICFFLLAATLRWLVFQARETVPGVTSRPLVAAAGGTPVV
jgi:hypothetical protein